MKTPKETLDQMLTVVKEQNGLGLSNTARVRLIYSQLQELLNAGMKHDFILKALKDSGLKMTMAGYKSAIQRIKAEQGGVPDNKPIPAIANDKPINKQVENRAPEITPEYSEDDWKAVHVKGSMLLDIAKKHGITPADLEGKSRMQVSEYLTGLNKKGTT
ncbi:hypothetical protein ABNR98_004413 [Salmonella enterica]